MTGSRQVKNKVRHRHGVGSVVLCIGEGQNRLLAWARAGQVTSWGESCEAPVQAAPTPLFSPKPASQAGRRQTASSQRLLPDSLPLLQHSRHNDSLPVPSPSPQSLSLSAVILLFPCISIHSPTARSTAAHHLNPGQPLPRLAFRGTILLVPHANSSSRRARSPEPKPEPEPAAQHPRNTASPPSSPSSSQHSPHPQHRPPTPPPPPPPVDDAAVSLATCSNPTPARLAFGPACCICKDSAASQSQSPTPSCVPVPAFLLQPATISPKPNLLPTRLDSHRLNQYCQYCWRSHPHRTT